jgi:hypothetical protein
LWSSAFVGACVSCLAAPLQAQFNLGATAGAVQYEQVAGTGSLGINPDLTLTRTRLLWNVGGTATTASDGSRSLEGATTLWGATPMVAEHVQLDGMLQAAYTSPKSDSSSYTLIGFGEAAFTGESYGLAVGGGVMRGGITGLSAVNALRASARAWKELGPWNVGVSIQPTALSAKVWFTDVTGTAEIDLGNKGISGTLLLRQSPATGLDLGGEGSFTIHLNPRVAFAASAGRYLRDPFQGLPGGYHINAGVVLTLWRPPERETEGVGKAELADVTLKSLGISTHGFGHSALRVNPATSKKLTGSGTSGTSGSTGRGHRL